jgi:hypothetical protein
MLEYWVALGICIVALIASLALFGAAKPKGLRSLSRHLDSGRVNVERGITMRIKLLLVRLLVLSNLVCFRYS